jgi:hypothetical protein
MFSIALRLRPCISCVFCFGSCRIKMSQDFVFSSLCILLQEFAQTVACVFGGGGDKGRSGPFAHGSLILPLFFSM